MPLLSRKRRFTAFSILTLALVTLAHARAGEPQPLRVLFIGNSYTYFNDLPKMLATLAKAGGQRPIVHDRETPGGWSFKKHLEGGKAVKKIEEKKWDYVVLQDFSLNPQQNPKEMKEFGAKLHEAVAKNGAKTLFYMTWARQNTPEKQAEISKAYRDLASEVKATVAPVGAAWELAFKEDPKLVLHNDDKSHPNPTGTYLAACVFYATLFQKSPEGLPGEPAKLDPAAARRLQAIAWRVVQQEKK